MVGISGSHTLTSFPWCLGAPTKHFVSDGPATWRLIRLWLLHSWNRNRCSLYQANPSWKVSHTESTTILMKVIRTASKPITYLVVLVYTKPPLPTWRSNTGTLIPAMRKALCNATADYITDTSLFHIQGVESRCHSLHSPQSEHVHQLHRNEFQLRHDLVLCTVSATCWVVRTFTCSQVTKNSHRFFICIRLHAIYLCQSIEKCLMFVSYTRFKLCQEQTEGYGKSSVAVWCSVV